MFSKTKSISYKHLHNRSNQVLLKHHREIFNVKTSNEVSHFVSSKTLSKIAVFHKGFWLSKNRAMLSNSNLSREMINLILSYNKSPLSISLVKHSHNLNDNHVPARPSSCFHTVYKQNQTKFLRFGVLLYGAPLFQQIELACLQCKRRKKKPFRVQMGPALQCMFNKIRLFNFTTIDIKGPFTL